MKTKTIELYEFDELPENVKAKVLDNNRHINVDSDWWSKFLLEDWGGKLEEMGFNEPKISFSGFSCQGDGASFTSKRVDVEKFIASQKAKGRFPAILKALKSEEAEISVEVESIDHHYSHEYTVTVNSDVYLNERIDSKKYEKIGGEGEELRGFVLDVVRTLSRKIYRELESAYFAETSDEAIIYTIKANEYTFRANGKMENS